LLRSIFRRLFVSLRPDLGPLPFRHVENLLDLVRRGDVGAAVELPDGARARLEHGVLTISHGFGPQALPKQQLAVPGTAAFEDAGLTITSELVPRRELPSRLDATADDTAYFDWEALAPPLAVRGRREGDRLRPFGMEGTKSLKELLIDSKIAASFRDAVPIACDQTGILWVVGVRRSATAPVTDTTRTVLTLSARAKEESPGPREDPTH
jgi:tRNA(Ile)-lysidine synthase